MINSSMNFKPQELFREQNMDIDEDTDMVFSFRGSEMMRENRNAERNGSKNKQQRGTKRLVPIDNIIIVNKKRRQFDSPCTGAAATATKENDGISKPQPKQQLYEGQPIVFHPSFPMHLRENYAERIRIMKSSTNKKKDDESGEFHPAFPEHLRRGYYERIGKPPPPQQQQQQQSKPRDNQDDIPLLASPPRKKNNVGILLAPRLPPVASRKKPNNDDIELESLQDSEVDSDEDELPIALLARHRKLRAKKKRSESLEDDDSQENQTPTRIGGNGESNWHWNLERGINSPTAAQARAVGLGLRQRKSALFRYGKDSDSNASMDDESTSTSTSSSSEEEDSISEEEEYEEEDSDDDDDVLDDEEYEEEDSDEDDDYDEEWEENFQRLLAYKKKHHTANAPVRTPILGKWVKKQRKNIKAKKLSRSKKKRLKALGFEFKIRDSNWDFKFQRLVKYKKKHNNVDVPRSHPTLGIWVKYQRDAFNNNILPVEKQQRLEGLGLILRKDQRAKKLPPPDDQWKENFEKLRLYKEQNNGSTMIPESTQGYDPLQRWVKYQRDSHSHNKLAQEKIDLLDSIDFQWNVPKGRPKGSSNLPSDQWNQSFEQVRLYKEKHCGSTVVPQSKQQYNPLARWVQEQRCLRSQNTLAKEKIDLLDSIDFQWNVPIGRPWLEKYQRLIDYKIKYGTFRVKPSHDKDLCTWAWNQRNNRLIQLRIDMLNQIGFDWK